MRKILITDIDGVLNCDTTTDTLETKFINYVGIDDDKIEKLKKIIDATDAYIVLSSTWRLHQEHRNHFLKKLGDYKNRYIDRTPYLMRDIRANEIHEWLQRQEDKDDISIAILDDMGCECLDRFGDAFIHTVESIGLTDEDVDKCIEQLNKNEKWIYEIKR